MYVSALTSHSQNVPLVDDWSCQTQLWHLSFDNMKSRFKHFQCDTVLDATLLYYHPLTVCQQSSLQTSDFSRSTTNIIVSNLGN